MITTARLTLRRAQDTDVEDMHRVFTHPEAMRYWHCLPHTELAQTQKFVFGMARASLKTSDDFIVEYQGRAIGKAGAGAWKRSATSCIRTIGVRGWQPKRCKL